MAEADGQERCLFLMSVGSGTNGLLLKEGMFLGVSMRLL
jgi:hypothetical protein